MPDAEGAKSPAAKNPASLPPNAAEVDSDWDHSDESESPAAAKALAPRPVISIGPPAQTPAETSQARSTPLTSNLSKEKRRQIESLGKDQNRRASIPPAESKSDVALLNMRSKAKVATPNAATKSEPPQSHSVFPAGVDSKSLEKLLTEGAEGDFSTSDIAQLVTNVMSRPKSEPPGAKTQPSHSVPPTDATAKVPEVVTRSEVAPLVSDKPSRGPTAETTEGVMEPDGWDLPSQTAPIFVEQTLPEPPKVEPVPVTPEPAVKLEQPPVKPEPAAKVEPVLVTPEPAAKVEPVPVTPEPTAKVEQPPVKPEPAATVSPKKSASKSTRTKEKARQIEAVKKAGQTAKAHAAADLDSGWTGEFFAVTPHVEGHIDEYHDHDVLIDERHLRSLSPEVRARRAKYRVIVLWLFVAMVILLAAAIALKVLHHH